MPDKSITRLMCGVKKQDGYLQPYMSPAVQGDYVRWEDHLEALGEAEKGCERVEREREDARKLEQEAVDQLRSLRLGLEAEIGRLRSEPVIPERWKIAKRLEALLDEAETAGEKCRACNHVHQGSDRCGAPIHPPTTECECVAKR